MFRAPVVRTAQSLAIALSQTTDSRFFQTRSLLTTISDIMNVAKCCSNGQKTLWEKEKFARNEQFLPF